MQPDAALEVHIRLFQTGLSVKLVHVVVFVSDDFYLRSIRSPPL